MIRNKKTIWIICALILVLAVCMTSLLLYNPDKDTSDNEEQDLGVIDIKYSGLAILTVQNDMGSYNLVSDQDGNLYIEDQDIDLYSENTIQNSLTSLSGITATRIISQDKEELNNYGLDDPLATVTYYDINGVIDKLYLGVDEPIYGGSYVMCDSKPGVYLVSDSIGKIMKHTLNDYRDFNLFPTFTSGDSTKQLKSIELIRSGSDAVYFEQQPFKENDVVIYYKMIDPVMTVANWEKMDLYVFTPLESLTADQWVEDTTDLGKYGLDFPDFVVNMDYQGEMVKLLFKDIDGETSYVTREGSGIIYTIANIKYEDLAEPYTSFIGDTAYIRNITTIGKIKVDINQKSYEFTVEGEGQGLSFFVDGTPIDSAIGISMYSILNNIPVKDRITKEDVPSQDVVGTITYTLRDGTIETIEFIDMGSREMALSINGEIHFKTYATILDDVRIAVNKASQLK